MKRMPIGVFEVCDKFGKRAVLVSKAPKYQDVVQGVKEYMAVLDSQPNGHGQHVNKDGVRSDKVLLALWGQFGESVVSAEVKRQFAEINGTMVL